MKAKTFLTQQKQKLTLVYFLFLTTSLSLFSQNMTVSGSVVDNLQTPLIGVSIQVKNSSVGTITDFDGKYSVNASSQDTLVYSYIGYENQEIPIGGRELIDISMYEAASTLDEIVVVGYGTKRRGDISGAVTSVDKDFLEQQGVANITKALQGSASGVTVVSAPTPGSNAQIRIRGMGTINNNNPLWVVDGVFDAPQPPPSQVESIEILKDASATAIYGARGANGVILVTTKAGKINQAPRVELSLRTGIESPDAKYDLMTDPDLIGQMLWLEMTNDGIDPSHPHYGDGDTPVLNEFLFPNGGSTGDDNTNLDLYDQQNYPITKANTQGTDWLDAIYRNALIQDYNLTVSGGSKMTNYSFNGSFLQQEGLLKFTQFDRYALRANVDTKVNDWLKVGQRLGITLNTNKGYNGNNSRGIFRSINEVSPLIPIRDEGGNYAGSVVGGLNDGPNPLAQLERLKDNKGNSWLMSGNIYGEVSPMSGITFKTLLGYNIINNRNFGPQLPAFEDVNGARSTALTEGSSNSTVWNWSNTVNYSTTLQDVHSLNVLVGYEARRSAARWMSASKNGFFSTDLNFLVLSAGATGDIVTGSASATTTLSQFGRVSYNYDNRYVLEATLRRDGSSVLGRNKFGVFPAISAAWRLSSEPFMGSNGWIDDLKLRASWGQSGNDQTNNPYNSYTTFNSNPGGSFYAIDGSDNNISLGYQTATVGNPDAKWETTTSMNFAIDASIFSRVDLTIDLWKKDTEDMLFNVQIPATAGSAFAPAVNIGSMSNRGMDLTLDYNGGSIGAFQYNVGLVFSTYKNEVTKLSENVNEFIVGDEIRGQSYTRAAVGTSFPEFYGYVSEGIFESQADADAHPANGTYNQAGNLIIKDVNEDGEITPEDRTFIGSPHPDYTAGLNLGIQYKGFDMSTFLYASVGNDIANYTSRFRRYGLFQGPKAPDRLFRSWGSPLLENNADAVLPKASSTTSFEQNASTNYIEDGSFLRVQNLQIGYNLQSSVLDKLNMSDVRIYLNISNLMTITGYEGLNPEVTSAFGREINRGVDIGGWPISKQFQLGINVSL